MRAAAFLSVILSLPPIAFAGQGTSPDASKNESPQVIKVIAKSYDFEPNEIRVRKGTRVQLRLRTADRAHGLALDLYPDGVHPDGNPGLIFAHPQDNAKVEHDQERVIEFVANRTGTYSFKCSVQCGLLGHGRMKGKLIVEE